MRLSNLETLRIVSILLILSMHIYSQIPKEDMIFENLLLGQLINAIGNIGVTCFVLISGYFGIIYLLDGIRIAISEHITHLEQYSSNPYLIICLCATISITFICSITIDKLRIAILGPAETKLIQIIQTQCKKVNYFINNHFNKL